MDRRKFFIDLARYSALAATTPNVWRLRWRPSFADDPFQLGVASGDPTPDGAILWTRLAPRPLEVLGGLATERTVVRWEVAEDDAFSKVVQRGNATAAPELGHSIHIDVKGLRSERWYFYRFMSGDAISDTGRLRTTPPDGAESPLRFAFASCQHYEQGYYTALQHLSGEEIDLAAHLGDYIYETAEPAATTAPRLRNHVGPNIHTIDDYRQRYGLYKSDRALRAAHARCPWIVTWDDHEVDNNYATLVNESPDETEGTMRTRRASAYQAWYEHQPVRLTPPRSWVDFRIYRTTNWGRLARFWTMDTRQYRWDQACGDGNKAVPCGDWADPNRTMIGAAQEQWLVNGLRTSQSRWQVLAQQVGFAPPDELVKDGDRALMDTWQGYPASRDRVLAAIADHAPNRTVVLTGDIHNNWVYDVKRGFDKTQRPIVATEFVGTSISSGGDGAPTIARITDAYLAARPSLKWANNNRGYVVCTVDSKTWRADYRTVPFVTRPDAPIETASSWRVEQGVAGVQRI